MSASAERCDILTFFLLILIALGHYVFIESTDCKYGQLASRLVSPLLGRNASCLRFYYHMYGDKISTLRVMSGKSTLWQLTGEQSQKWFKATVPLKFPGTFHVSYAVFLRMSIISFNILSVYKFYVSIILTLLYTPKPFRKI